MDNEAYLKQLAEMEKKNKQTELAQAKASALTAIEQEKAKVLPTFTAQKQQASVQSQLGAKNLAEFWANRGQTNAGISAQAEMSRQNALASTLGNIGTQEAQAMTDYSNQALAQETAYQSGLTNAYNTIDTNLQTNLYNDKLAQQKAKAEAEQYAYEQALAQQKYENQLKQQAFENELALKNFNLNYAKVLGTGNKPIEGTIKLVNGQPQVYANGKWTVVKYTTAGTKTEKFNRQGYGLLQQQTPITYKKDGKTYNYQAWIKDGQTYIIANDMPILVGGDENSVYTSVKNAVANKAISSAKAAEIMNTFFPSTVSAQASNQMSPEKARELLRAQGLDDKGNPLYNTATFTPIGKTNTVVKKVANTPTQAFQVKNTIFKPY